MNYTNDFSEGIEVPYITMGEASKRLDTSPSTLRFWTDQLENLGVHYVHRNERKDRLYEVSDLQVFDFIRRQKKLHGRKTTMKDLAGMLQHMDKEGEIEIRSREDVPEFEETEEVADLLNHTDIKSLLENEGVRQFNQMMIQEIGEKLREELKEEMRLEIQNQHEIFAEQLQEIQASNERIEKSLLERDKKITEHMNQLMEEKNKGFFARLFNK